MTKVRLADPVRLPDGTVTTCAKLLDTGQGALSLSERFGTTNRRAYFVDVTDDAGRYAGSFEIGEMAYKSRTGQL